MRTLIIALATFLLAGNTFAQDARLDYYAKKIDSLDRELTANKIRIESNQEQIRYIEGQKRTSSEDARLIQLTQDFAQEGVLLTTYKAVSGTCPVPIKEGSVEEIIASYWECQEAVFEKNKKNFLGYLSSSDLPQECIDKINVECISSMDGLRKAVKQLEQCK